MAKFILQIDGGGIRGIMPAVVLEKLEEVTGKPCHKIFDLITGTSTGAIIAGMLGIGVPAARLRRLYVDDGAMLFRKRSWWKRLLGAKYSRVAMQEIMRQQIKIYADGPKFGDAKTRVMTTTFNGSSGRSHFQMSWNDYHAGLDTIDVVSWSALSAILYFGPIGVPDYEYKLEYQRTKPIRTRGAVFYDGGQGRNNCTLLEAVTTGMDLGWVGHEDVHVLSIGTGAPRLFVPYRQANNRNKVQRIGDYIGQSREEAVYDQIHKVATMAESTPGLDIHRLDCIIEDDENKLDALKYVNEFVEYGDLMAKDLSEVFLGA